MKAELNMLVKPLQKYGKRLDKYLPLRIAGKIWQTSETEEKRFKT